MLHNFIGTGERGYARCLACGGLWGTDDGDYISIDGKPASPCRGLLANGDGGRCHHYAHECPVDECSLDPECNCLFCHS